MSGIRRANLNRRINAAYNNRTKKIEIKNDILRRRVLSHHESLLKLEARKYILLKNYVSEFDKPRWRNK